MDRYELQRQAEEKYVNIDKEAMEKALNDAQVDSSLQQTAVGLKLIKELADDMVDNFDKYFTSQLTTPVADLLKSTLTPETLAGATASALVDGACAGPVKQEVYDGLAVTYVDMLIEALIHKSEGSKASKRINDRLKKINKDASIRNKAEEMHKAMKYYADAYSIDLDDEDSFTQVAQSMVEKMADRSGYFDSVGVENDENKFDPALGFKKSDANALVFNKKAYDTIENLKAFVVENSIKLRPMRCRPLPWTGLLDGGYLTPKYQAKVRMVKGFMDRKNLVNYDRDLNNSSDIDILRNSLNAIQDTAFVINKHVNALLSEILEKDAAIMGVPSQKSVKRARGMSREHINTIAKNEKTRSSKYRSIIATKTLADEFQNETEFYMPYNLDFRGRAYCVVTELSPQGSDLQKAMLLFATPKSLGEDGHKWLKIHAANCYGHGLDKAPMSERIAWIDNNKKLIGMVARGCLTRAFVDLMKDVDNAPEDPFLFFAACRELDEINHLKKSQIKQYKSSIPVSVDGSNNGLQHYAALLRNVSLSEKVNLHVLGEDDVPSDVYMKVAEGMIEKLTANNAAADIASSLKIDDVESVEKAIGYIVALEPSKHRKLVKRSTMTQAYAVTAYGMVEQIDEVINDLFTSDEASAKGGKMTLVEATVMAILTKVTFEGFKAGLKKHCEAAKVGMQFLKNVASAKRGKITWTTPSGFVANQHYLLAESRMTETYVGKRAVRIKYSRKTDKLNNRKQVSAMAPNFIHSMDASHMMLTINALLNKKGFAPSFFMIHDSFGTYAGQLEELSAAIRAEFVKMYSVNQFENFLNQVALTDEQREDEAESLRIPEFGDFNLEDVNKASYFFA